MKTNRRRQHITLLLAEVINLSILPIVCFITDQFFSKPLSISVTSPSSSIMCFLIASVASLIYATDFVRPSICQLVFETISSSNTPDDPFVLVGCAPEEGPVKFLLLFELNLRKFQSQQLCALQQSFFLQLTLVL